MVGERGFEPPAPASRRQCSTWLSYSPTGASGPQRCGPTGRQTRLYTGVMRGFQLLFRDPCPKKARDRESRAARALRPEARHKRQKIGPCHGALRRISHDGGRFTPPLRPSQPFADRGSVRPEKRPSFHRS